MKKIKIRRILTFFIVALSLSGITAFPIVTLLDLAVNLLDTLNIHGSIFDWTRKVTPEITQVYTQFPYIAYGTDWLAFAHLVISVVFIGPIIDPVKNKWCIQFGMIACLMVFPLALIAGPIREIPFTWRLVDCSFGFFGFFMLWRVLFLTNQMELESS